MMACVHIDLVKWQRDQDVLNLVWVENPRLLTHTPDSQGAVLIDLQRVVVRFVGTSSARATLHTLHRILI